MDKSKYAWYKNNPNGQWVPQLPSAVDENEGKFEDVVINNHAAKRRKMNDGSVLQGIPKEFVIHGIYHPPVNFGAVQQVASNSNNNDLKDDPLTGLFKKAISIAPAAVNKLKKKAALTNRKIATKNLYAAINMGLPLLECIPELLTLPLITIITDELNAIKTSNKTEKEKLSDSLELISNITDVLRSIAESDPSNVSVAWSNFACSYKQKSGGNTDIAKLWNAAISKSGGTWSNSHFKNRIVCVKPAPCGHTDSDICQHKCKPRKFNKRNFRDRDYKKYNNKNYQHANKDQSKNE